MNEEIRQAFAVLESDANYYEKEEALIDIEGYLNMHRESLYGNAEERGYHWPDFTAITYEELSRKVGEIVKELADRPKLRREQALERALEIWPDLHEALRAKGKIVALNDMASPRFIVGRDEPVVALQNCYDKPRLKRDAWEVARTQGDGSWATMGELWLWLHDTGSIMDRAMEKFGYCPVRKKG